MRVAQYHGIIKNAATEIKNSKEQKLEQMEG
jgi:hypothetical protein